MNKEVRQWKQYYGRNIVKYAKLKLGLHRFVNPNFTSRKINAVEDTNAIISSLLKTEKPFMVCRFGETEVRAVADAIGIQLGAKKTADPERLNRLYNNAGVFPHGQDMELRFSDLMCDVIPEADVIGVWNTFMQDYIIDKYVDQTAKLAVLKGLEPYYSNNPWSKSLAGKKVLVIHPFAITIEKQYKKRELLFENTDILPEFELKTLKSVQTIAGQKDERFSDWFEALDFMFREAMKIDFDVAIIGCGAYGLPLAAQIKRAGKQAIHLGGATQILFGIKGNRWDTHPVISKLYNDHWTRPDVQERPSNMNIVENGCYW